MQPIFILSLCLILAGCTANARFDISGKPAGEAPPAPSPAQQVQPVQQDVLGWSAKQERPFDKADLQVIVVRDGDTLYSLAKQYGVTVDMIYASNGLRSDHLTPGQHLVIPKTQRAPNLLADPSLSR